MNSEMCRYIENLKNEYFQIINMIEIEELILNKLREEHMSTLSSHSRINMLNSSKNEIEKTINIIIGIDNL